jgi:hypothetical protein
VPTSSLAAATDRLACSRSASRAICGQFDRVVCAPIPDTLAFIEGAFPAQRDASVVIASACRAGLMLAASSSIIRLA